MHYMPYDVILLSKTNIHDIDNHQTWFVAKKMARSNRIW